ncbi:MAG: hypothetical protein K8R18_10205 [Parvibaculum sp.]|uniref:hypothetical protein n=1 Tax=Parvibaculum sp. TaxID=2024848 RepID=UPI0025DE2391|nr:hypothetical protein [Parvibaculum sp.]MCE9649983.1 hypothetical protein [Parvibaculum sp.]
MPFPTERQDAPRRTASAARAVALAGLLMMPLALGGCSWLGMGSDDDDLDEIEASAPKPCPTIGVLDGADRITVFNGSGRDLTDVVVRAEITKAAIKCDYDTDDHTISVDLAFNGGAEMGPAATSRDMTLKGFLAVTRTDGKKVSKQIYDIPVSFGTARTVRFLKSVEGTVVPYGGTVNGSIYEFLIGFQLTPDQFEYNSKVPLGPMR